MLSPKIGAQAAAPVAALAFGLLALAQLAAVFTHSPWGDELQAVLLARDAHRLGDWYWNFRYEGHPPLWHLLLRVPLELGLSPEMSLRVLLAPFVLANLWLAWRLPFPAPLRFAVASSYYLAFEYGVIARPYTMGVTLILAAVLFRARWQAWAAIALLPACGLQFILLAFICACLAWRAGNRSIVGGCVAALSAGFALVWIWPAADFEAPLSVGIILRDHLESAFVSVMRAGLLLTPLDWTGAPLQWSLPIPGTRLMLLAAGLAAPFVALATMRKPALFGLALALFIAATFTLSIGSYVLSARHFGLIYILALALTIVRAEEEGRVSRVFTAWTFLLALQGLVALGLSFRAPFGPFDQVAAWARSVATTDAVFIPVEPGLGNEITLANGRATLDVTQSCWQTFTRTRAPSLRRRLREMAGEDALETEAGARALLSLIRAGAAGAGGRAYILTDSYPNDLLARLNDPELTLVASLPPADARNPFSRFVYELRTTPAPRDFPACAAPRGD